MEYLYQAALIYQAIRIGAWQLWTATEPTHGRPAEHLCQWLDRLW